MGWASLFGLVSLLIGVAVLWHLNQPFRRERLLIGLAYITGGVSSFLLNIHPDGDGDLVGLIHEMKDLTLLMVLAVFAGLYRSVPRYRALLLALRAALLVSMAALAWVVWRYPASFSAWPLEDRGGFPARVVVGGDSLLLAVAYLLVSYLILRSMLRAGFRHRVMAGALVLGFLLTSVYNAIVVAVEVSPSLGPVFSPLQAGFFAALFLTIGLLPGMPPFVQWEVRRLSAFWQRRRMRQKLRILLNLEILADQTLAGREAALRETALRAGVPEEDIPALLYAAALSESGPVTEIRLKPKPVRPHRPAALLGEEPGSLYEYVESSWRCALLAGQIVSSLRGEMPASPRVAELMRFVQQTPHEEKGSRP